MTQILNLKEWQAREAWNGQLHLNLASPPENLPLPLFIRNWHKMRSMIILNSRSQKLVTVISQTCIQFINWFIDFNLMIYFLVLYHDLRQQRFPTYLSRPSLLGCLPGSYSHHILISYIWRQRFTRTAILHRVHSQSIKQTHMPNSYKGSIISIVFTIWLLI